MDWLGLQSTQSCHTWLAIDHTIRTHVLWVAFPASLTGYWIPSQVCRGNLTPPPPPHPPPAPLSSLQILAGSCGRMDDTGKDPSLRMASGSQRDTPVGGLPHMPIAPHNACKKARNGSNVTISLCCLNVLFPWVPVNGTGYKERVGATYSQGGCGKGGKGEQPDTKEDCQVCLA